ncbi:MAG: hypothetical protein VZQ98_16130 [Bacteroidales bacterium]|nr:hypothetical protein [Bacteroidales bacterium]
MHELVAKFQRTIVETASEETESKSNDEIVADAISGMYDDLLSETTESYEVSRSILQPMIGGMGANPKACLLFQLKRFIPKMEEWFNNLMVVDDNVENSPYINSGCSYDIYQFMNSKTNFPQKIRLADVDSRLIANLNEKDRIQLFSTLVHVLQNPKKILNDDNSDINTMLLLLCAIRSIAITDDVKPLFYQAFYNVIDRVNHSEWKQHARDLAEESLACAYKDGMSHYGFLGLMKLYAIQNDKNGTLLYANSLMESLKTIKQCPKSFVFEFLWTVMKLYRTVGVKIGKLTDCIKNIFDELDCSVTKTLFFYNTYYNMKALELPTTIQFEIETFLDKYRESIFHLGEHSAVPWYVLIKQIGEKQGLSLALEVYLKQFQMMLSKETLNSIVMNAVNKTDTYASLKESITKLMSTRDNQNYNIDSTITIKLAKQLLPIAYQEKSQEKMLTAMAVLNDFSFIRQSFVLDNEINPLEVMPIERDKIESIYANPNGPISILRNIKDDSFIWIAEGEDGSYITTKCDQSFNFNFFEGVHSADFRKSRALVQQKLIFDTYDAKSRLSKDIKSYEDEAAEINQGLSTSCFDFPHAQRLMFAKDSSYAFYPHQLFFNPKTNRLYAEDYPTSNFISTEFLLQNIDKCKISGSLTKAFWSPKDLDWGLAQSYSHLSDILENFKIEIYAEESQLKDYYPIKPLNSSINILCAHGNEKGKDAYCFSAGDVKFSNLNKMVGKGELLILFVCHSGSMDNSNFDSAIHTMIKIFIRAGYQAVIAPMWALSTEILPKWLETFMARFEEGDFVVDALYKANMAVKKEYPTPSAWANLHLFGNPYLHVQK